MSSAASSATVAVRISAGVTMSLQSGGDVRLVGGEPKTLMRLRAAAFPEQSRPRGELPRAGDVVRVPPATAEVLFRRGAATPYPEPPRGWPAPSVLRRTGLVIPCKDDARGLVTALAGVVPLAQAGLRVWVVDDGSREPLAQQTDQLAVDCEILRNEAAKGAAAARNRGIAAAEAAGCELVVTIDADTVPHRTEWLGLLTAHLDREAVAAVAPRVIAAEPGRGGVQGFETARSALDMGHLPAFVRPRTAVAYVPSAALLLHMSRVRAALGSGPIFNENMHVAEDVDLCWRLVGAGAEVLYEPDARVAHQHRTQLIPLLRRRMFYGEGAARLARDHAWEIAPAVFSVRMLIGAAGLWWARPWSLACAAIAALWSSMDLYPKVGRDARLTSRLVLHSYHSAVWQLASAALRPYAPLSLAVLTASAVSGRGRRFRRVLAVAAVTEGLRHWWRQHAPERLPLNRPLTHIVLHRLDDCAYGFGVWRSALRARSARALLPEVRW